MKHLLIAGAFACLSFGVAAQECTTQSFDQVAKIIDESKGEIIAIVDVDGVEFDQVMIARHGPAIVLGRFKDGCAVGGPSAVGLSLKGLVGA